MAITEAQITAFNRFLNVTNGREKACRFVQYFARFYAFYLLRQGGSNPQRWIELKNHLGIGRKFFRLLKPVELAQSGIKSLSLPDPFLRATQCIKFTSNFLYYTSEAMSLLDTIKFHKLDNPKRVTEFGQKCWLMALSASILSSLYQLYIAPSAKKSTNEAARYQLTQDIVDMMIPLGGLKWLNLDEGAIGLAGMITSAMAIHTQWKKTNP
ncbi:peroxisomal biogenesis factor 11 [Mucor mucedo]|uniref:peroxisomal biogenesis factor 11 n=1 Tax=Mucor mucedo TaxID=29922 RepID=UPI00221F606F|nr:peroxisomal biogenesis factor 11 [Mucor mucedo]KAI7896466.1 peroxisomal biogenesis factor 11 [Mucor mucedo]